MNEEALKHLRAADPVLARVIRHIGACSLRPNKRRAPFEALVHAVANQQLHARAAATILGRFRLLFPGLRFPQPTDLAQVSDDQLRACGFSRAKIASIRDIADKAIGGVIPSTRRLSRCGDEELITRLTEIRGVGRWTVEMLLIFRLGRPDVLPVDDFGIRNGFRLAFGLDEMPKPREVYEHGERWRPHRTTASWYLWRAGEVLAKNPIQQG